MTFGPASVSSSTKTQLMRFSRRWWNKSFNAGKAMELSDTQLNYFVDNRLKLPKGKRSEYLAPVDHLIERFDAAAKGDSLINIKKFLKTGSLRKGTVLRPRGSYGVDADVAVFLNANGASGYDLATQHSRIR